MATETKMNDNKPAPAVSEKKTFRNLVGSIYGRFSIRIAHFVPIINKHGRHRQLLSLMGQFLRIFYSETW
jgi:hypothetical protein